MSRREDRSSESKRHRSRFDREPSPKRSRRDGKPETEMPPTEPDLDKDRADRDHRHHRRLQDPLPLESGTMSRESEKGADGHKVVAKYSSDSTKMPQPRSYFQHDDRASAGQNGRGFSRRTDSERGWWRDSNEQRNDRSFNKTVPGDAEQKDEKSKDNRESNQKWRHDGYLEMEANPNIPARKRPAFREQKIPTYLERISKPADDSVMPKPQDHAIYSGRRNEREYNSRFSNRHERPVAGESEMNRGQSWRDNFSSGANNRYRGRDRFPAQQGYRPSGGRVEKWKHDLYNEANKIPPRKNEEDQISKIEALLTSLCEDAAQRITAHIIAASEDLSSQQKNVKNNSDI